MLDLKLVAAVISVCSALLSAWWWWRSSTMKLRTVSKLPDTLGDGDLAFGTRPGEFIHWRVHLQSQLNARAAIAAAVAISLQVASDYLPSV